MWVCSFGGCVWLSGGLFFCRASREWCAYNNLFSSSCWQLLFFVLALQCVLLCFGVRGLLFFTFAWVFWVWYFMAQSSGAVLLLSLSLRVCFVLLLWLLIPWLGGWLTSSLVCCCVLFGGFVLIVVCSLCLAFVSLLGFGLCYSLSF